MTVSPSLQSPPACLATLLLGAARRRQPLGFHRPARHISSFAGMMIFRPISIPPATDIESPSSRNDTHSSRLKLALGRVNLSRHASHGPTSNFQGEQSPQRSSAREAHHPAGFPTGRRRYCRHPQRLDRADSCNQPIVARRPCTSRHDARWGIESRRSRRRHASTVNAPSQRCWERIVSIGRRLTDPDLWINRPARIHPSTARRFTATRNPCRSTISAVKGRSTPHRHLQVRSWLGLDSEKSMTRMRNPARSQQDGRHTLVHGSNMPLICPDLTLSRLPAGRTPLATERGVRQFARPVASGDDGASTTGRDRTRSAFLCPHAATRPR